MTIEILGLMHAGVRVGKSEEDIAKAKNFYQDLLGLEVDGERPEIKGIPGFWNNIRPGERGQQLHIMGAEGMSPAARSEKHDPTRTHVAFAVKDLDAARADLEARDIEYWEYTALVGTASDQIFFEDPFGNVIELQEG